MKKYLLALFITIFSISLAVARTTPPTFDVGYEKQNVEFTTNFASIDCDYVLFEMNSLVDYDKPISNEGDCNSINISKDAELTTTYRNYLRHYKYRYNNSNTFLNKHTKIAGTTFRARFSSNKIRKL